MIKVIILDLWGTLVENGVWSPIKQVKNILGIKSPFSEYVVRMERAMMTEKYPTLKEAFENICKEFNVECEQEKIEMLIGMWNKSWMLARPYEEAMEELRKLGEKYKLVLVSNTDCFSVNQVLDKFKMREFFDNIFLSYEVHLIKTDKNFLKTVLDDIGYNVEECVIVGDSIQSDMVAAKRLGMKAILVDRKNTRDFHPKIKNLKELEKALEF
ncbi:MAG: HAD family hydrolase [Nanoarchaeota archaeon]|nr:HAD family hydrolase [Nanoarchaeota archaeon]MBU1632159.1 HAD family hydrolase [Nanoarchaeota archaeon]MBU1876360.1 HAD family hydrolase [Nanoarchaeota archaeon]